MHFPQNASPSLFKWQRDGSHTTAWICDNSHIKKGPFRSSQGCFQLPLGKHAPQPHFVALAIGQPTHMRDKERGLWTTKKVSFSSYFLYLRTWRSGEDDWALILFYLKSGQVSDSSLRSNSIHPFYHPYYRPRKLPSPAEIPDGSKFEQQCGERGHAYVYYITCVDSHVRAV
jgi:hypothetical protein